MSERIPTAEDIRLALIAVGYTHYEADDAIEAVKRRTAHDRAVTLLDTKKTHERTIAELRHDLAVAREELADLRWENRRLEAGAEGVVSLGGLDAAWEAAEEADECRKGDVLIRRDDYGGYNVYPAASSGAIWTARILSRAPGPEPWQDLADVIGEHTYEPDPKWLAQALYRGGVRVTDGGE